MDFIVCPLCREPISISSKFAKCNGGHTFPVIRDIVDFMPSVTDTTLLSKEKYWDTTAEKGWPESSTVINPYMDLKIFQDLRKILERYIISECPNYQGKNICIGEIGCGDGSAISFLERLEFPFVYYVGIDISLKMMESSMKHPFPSNWDVQFVKCNADLPIFKENSLDIVFSVSVLHHFVLDNVIEWISKSLKSGGLFILVEPSIGNPFAKMGRKLGLGLEIGDKVKKYLLPDEVKLSASKHELSLDYEKGLHFLTSPLYYFLGIFKSTPKSIAFCAYHFAKFIDLFIRSPSWNYSFIQIYKKDQYIISKKPV